MTFVQKTLRHLPELSSLSDPDGNGLGIEARLKIVIPPESLIESIQEPTAVFAVQQTRLGEMLPIGRMNAGVSAVLQALFPKQRSGGMEHRVVGSAGSKLRVV